MTSVSTAPPGLEAASPHVTPERRRRGVLLIRGATILLGLVILFQLLAALGYISFGFANWQPVLFAYVLWSVALCWGLVLRDGEAGWRAVFVLPAVLFTVALVIFPTFFGLYIAFSDWNLQSADGQKFNGLDNFYQLIADP